MFEHRFGPREQARIVLAVSLLFGFTAREAQGVSPRTWRTGGAEDWNAAHRESIAVSSEGEIRLSLSTSRARGLESFVVWDLLADGDAVLAATGDNGALYRITPRGEAQEIVRASQPELTALGRDHQGRILVGASPDGIIYRLDGGVLEPVAETGETYIWRILPHPDGGAMVATGDAGKIYRLDAKGTLELFTDSGSGHVTGLELQGDGYLVTTDSPGRLLKLGKDGKTTVLFDGEAAELRAPLPATDGNIYFIVNPEDGSGGVYRRTPKGGVEPVWHVASGVLYSLRAGAEGTLWVTTGSDDGSGAVVHLTPGPPVEWVELITLSEPQIPAVLSRGSDITWVGTGGVGRVYRVHSDKAGRGLATGEVKDAGGIARWGALTLESGPVSGGVVLETRSGNTRQPDGSWTGWERVNLEGDRGQISSPAARFLQWRVTLTQPDNGVGGVRVAYLPANRAPRITSFSVSELGASLARSGNNGGPPTLYQVLPGGVRVEFQPKGGPPSGGAPPDEDAAWVRRYRAVTWEASDPHGDTLTHEIYIRALGETSWRLLEKDRPSTPWIWDSATVPDGWYALRLVSSDKKANPRGEELTAFRTSDPFLVDNTPPRVTDLKVSRGRVQGLAEDAESPIKRLEIAVDGQQWSQVFPTDGISDMPRERFETTFPDLSPGHHVVVIRVFDLAGNPGTGRVSFTVP